MCCLSCKYHVAVRRLRVAVGGQPSFCEYADVDSHLFACPKGCFEIRIATISYVISCNFDDGTEGAPAEKSCRVGNGLGIIVASILRTLWGFIVIVITTLTT
jgi:hypothetical protein